MSACAGPSVSRPPWPTRRTGAPAALASRRTAPLPPSVVSPVARRLAKFGPQPLLSTVIVPSLVMVPPRSSVSAHGTSTRAPVSMRRSTSRSLPPAAAITPLPWVRSVPPVTAAATVLPDSSTAEPSRASSTPVAVWVSGVWNRVSTPPPVAAIKPSFACGEVCRRNSVAPVLAPLRSASRVPRLVSASAMVPTPPIVWPAALTIA